jgi:hypothetical protein
MRKEMDNSPETEVIQKALAGKTVSTVDVNTTETGEVFSLVIKLNDGSKVNITPNRNRSLEVLTD